MTDMGYMEIVKRIESHSVDTNDIPSELTVGELQQWLMGYACAVAKIEEIVSELSHGPMD